MTDIKRRVYITGNTEYYVRGGVCVAVRDLETRKWESSHRARGRRLVGGMRRSSHGTLDVQLGEPRLGDRLCFKPDLLTSAVRRVRVPDSTFTGVA